MPLAVLFDRYHRLVRGIAGKIVRDPVEAEDLMQNVFVEIMRAVGQFDSGGHGRVAAQGAAAAFICDRYAWL